MKKPLKYYDKEDNFVLILMMMLRFFAHKLLHSLYSTNITHHSTFIINS